VGAIEVVRLGWARPGGRTLLDDVSFQVGDGQHAALVGANGAGKTTLLRILAGEEPGSTGSFRVDGQIGYLPQLVGSITDGTTVLELLRQLSPPRLRAAADALARAEAANDGSGEAGLRLAEALAAWGEAGGYEAEVHWDACTTRALGLGLEEATARPVSTFSGGEQKRLGLEVLLRSDAAVLLLDEPDNFLDVPGKRWLEERLNACSKTVLYVSHDRELLARTSHRVITVEGQASWTHGGSFVTYHDARQARLERLDDEYRQWQDERRRLTQYLREMKRRAAISDVNASRARASETRLRHFEQAGPPPEPPGEQSVTMRLGGGRTGKRVLTAARLGLTGLTEPFDLEVFFGERVAVLGRNGTGKSQFLRLVAGGTVAHTGELRLGARVVPGHFSQTHEHPELSGRTLLDILYGYDLVRGPALSRLRRYELQGCAEQAFSTLSGGQQARFQVLLLELSGATLLLLDEPTDNLDLVSADALEDALAAFEGTVMAVTHDRWFLRSFDRQVVFEQDGRVHEAGVASTESARRPIKGRVPR
jgi:ATPase subunit of ABC transporter with duplicated ATPase domains